MAPIFFKQNHLSGSIQPLPPVSVLRHVPVELSAFSEICYSSLFASFDSDSAEISGSRPVQPVRPGMAEHREKDKKRKHARNANNGQLTRLDEGTTVFLFFGPKRSTDTELFSAEIVRNSLAYLVTTKKGSPVLVDRREDTLITEMKAQNSL